MALADTITNLTARRDAIAAELASFTATTGEGPDFSIDGVSVNWDAHKKALLDELKSVNETLELLQGPAIFYTQGR
jgi:hypothetical protein